MSTNRLLHTNRATRARAFFLLSALLLARLAAISTAATFPALDSETRLPTNGPVAISGDTAIVGNQVYVRTPAGWLFRQVLDGSGAVALDGDTAVVGPNVYFRTGGHWDLQATLTFPFSQYGECVAMHQDLIAVGEPDAGLVYIFERTNSTWVLQTQLTPSDPDVYMEFGASVALDGNTLVVGAPGHLYAYPDYKPRAYIYSLAGESWSLDAEVTNNAPFPVGFGESVGVGEGTVAVGDEESVAPVTLFTPGRRTWQAHQILSLGGSLVPGHAGNVSPLAMQGSGLAIADASEIVHVFDRPGFTWNESQLLSSGTASNYIEAVAISTNAVITGSSDYRSRNAFIYYQESSTWQEQDVGDTGAAGSLDANTNVLSISGAGADIGGTADAFHFVYRPYSNDLEMTVRVDSIGGEDSYSRGGIMFRSSLDAGSPHIFVCVRQGQQIFFQNRTETNAQGVLQHGPWVGAPYWLKLRKIGSNVVASISEDGSVWQDSGPLNLNLPNTFYIGLAVTSEKTGVLATDVFDHLNVSPIAVPEAVSNLTATTVGVDSINLSWTANSDKASQFVVKRRMSNYYDTNYYPVATVPGFATNFTDVGLVHNTNYSYIVQALEPHGFGSDSAAVSATTWKLPMPWLEQDIGAEQLPGDAYYTTFGWPYENGIVVHSGATNTSVEGLHFVYQQWTGDFDFRARVEIEQITSATNAKAGLMIRGSLDATSPYAFAYMTESNGDRFVTGNLPGGTNISTGGSYVHEFRIVRRGNTFTVFQLDPVVEGALVPMATQTLNLPEYGLPRLCRGGRKLGKSALCPFLRRLPRRQFGRDFAANSHSPGDISHAGAAFVDEFKREPSLLHGGLFPNK